MVVDKMVRTNGIDKMVYGQNGIGQNGMDKMLSNSIYICSQKSQISDKHIEET